MDAIIEIFKTILGPATIGLAIVCIVNWMKMIPGGQNPNLNWLWPLIAGILGSMLLLVYVWALSLVVLDPKQVVIICIVGLFLGLGSAGLYTLVTKVGIQKE